MAISKSDIITGSIRDKIVSKLYKNGDKLPTEMSLAESYGVSRQTIRKALSALVDERMLESIQGSGYYVLKTSPSYRRSMSITVITTFIGEYIFPSILRGIEKTASEQGYSITIRATNNSISMERQILDDLLHSPVDGILVEGTKAALPNPNIAFYEQMAENGIPIVFFNCVYPRLYHNNIRYVVTDDYDGGKIFVEYLAVRGITNIGGLFKSDDIQGTLRFSGFIDTIMKSGLPFNDRHVGWFTTETRSSFMNPANVALKAIITGCEAVVCYNDEIARGLVNILDSLPEGESSVKVVCSFDNILQVKSATGVEVFSLGYPRADIGRLITEKLIRMIDGHHEESIVLPWSQFTEAN